MPIQRVNNINLYYEQHGQGEDLILIGGLATNHLIWASMLPYFANKHRVLLLDNRASGQSDTPSPLFSIAEMAEDVIALMDHLQIEQAHVLGHSMGGMIVQQLLIDHPKRVKKAVICSSSPKMLLTSVMTMNAQAALWKDGAKPEALMDAVIPWLYGNAFLTEANVSQLKQLMMQDPFPQSYEGFFGQVNAIATFDVRHQLAGIHHDALVIVGRDDILTPVSCSQLIHRDVQSSKLHIIDHAAHMLMMEATDEFIDVTLQYLGNN